MTPRRSVWLAGGLAVAAWILASTTRDAPPAGPAIDAGPDRIVVILIDALRADRLPFYGHPRNTAPFLAKLAAEGVVFEQAYATSTWTPSSVASIFTGLYPNQHQVLTGYNLTRRTQDSERPLRLNRIPDTAPTLPEILRAAGFRTFGVANNPNIGEKMGFARGFDRFAQQQERTADVIDAQVAQWRDELRGSGRSFLYLHYMDTHKPYQRHAAWFDPGQRNRELARYDSSIGYVDSRLAELFDRLGWSERTLIVLLADHGEEFRDHGGEGHTNQLYSELLRVPLVIWSPGRIQPGRVAAPVSLVDILPTLVQLAGGPPPPAVASGISLVPALAGGPVPERSLFAMRWSESEDPPLIRKAVIRGRWKYIVSSPGELQELYDLLEDPRELRNRIDRDGAIAAQLRLELERFEAEAHRHERAYADSELPARELQEQLRSLGYVE